MALAGMPGWSPLAVFISHCFSDIHYEPKTTSSNVAFRHLPLGLVFVDTCCIFVMNIYWLLASVYRTWTQNDVFKMNHLIFIRYKMMNKGFLAKANERGRRTPPDISDMSQPYHTLGLLSPDRGLRFFFVEIYLMTTWRCHGDIHANRSVL